MTIGIEKLIKKHPCYNKNAKDYGRIHLPVAPKCNVLCNFCNRKYDCLNESRPGVTSQVLTPKEAALKTIFYREKLPYLTVAGIAGPGDPLANAEKTRQTFNLIRKIYPDMHLCLSTNGLSLLENIDWIEKLGIKHVTVTVNGIDPAIVEKIYSFAVKDGRVYKNREMAELITENQIKGIRKLLSRNILVKVNTVIIPGINDNHIIEVGKFMKELGIYIYNVIPMIPVEGTVFWKKGIKKPPQKEKLKEIKNELEKLGLKIMNHCGRCRADAVGRIRGEQKRKNKFITVASSNGYDLFEVFLEKSEKIVVCRSCES
ncbi:nitrogenase cofactor biosynthesis protein NifB [Desulfurobacterium thermolithotrophum]|uniref:nitrogenase cofactor biosynthesis protein NifB n=1 Tax=Desulfurobacterium thermolithotrophum TaxID=64160 RepID=UPI0013D29989|nr:nitrogenase cofactor biosynthesis protein NifB [Desulfurobacterium thermolithotrophum]